MRTCLLSSGKRGGAATMIHDNGDSSRRRIVHRKQVTFRATLSIPADKTTEKETGHCHSRQAGFISVSTQGPTAASVMFPVCSSFEIHINFSPQMHASGQTDLNPLYPIVQWLLRVNSAKT